MANNSKERLFEVMKRVDNTFTGSLNEYGVTLGHNISTPTQRPLSQIAREIYQDWKPVSPYAKPYLEAMSTMDSAEDNYGMDSGREIVIKFLGNASTWRGENAKRIKSELKKMIGLKEEVEEEIGVEEAKQDKVNPKYTHFAVLANNLVVNGWDYRGYEQQELNGDKKHYFLDDIKDMQINPKDVRVITTKRLLAMGINPFDFSYWNKDNSVFTLPE